MQLNPKQQNEFTIFFEKRILVFKRKSVKMVVFANNCFHFIYFFVRFSGECKNNKNLSLMVLKEKTSKFHKKRFS